jgi:hypothetical protein
MTWRSWPSSGLVRSCEYNTDISRPHAEGLTDIHYRVPRDVDARIRAYLRNVPFKHTPPPVQPSGRAKSIAEVRESMDDEGWNKYMQEFSLRRLQYEMVAGGLLRSWAAERPDLFYDVMQQYTAQKRWHKLALSPSEQRWVEMPKERGSPDVLPLIEMVLDHMGRKEGKGSPPASATSAASSTSATSTMEGMDRHSDKG